MTPREEDKPNIERGDTDPRDLERVEALERRLSALAHAERAAPSDEIGERIAAQSSEALRAPQPQASVLARIGGPWRIAAGLLLAASAVALVGVLSRPAPPGSTPVAELPADEALETWIMDVATWDEMDFESTRDLDDAIALTDDAFSSWSDDVTLFEETL